MPKIPLPLVLSCLLAFFNSTQAASRMYLCSNGSSRYYTDKPCAANPANTLGTVGPAPTYSPAPTWVPSVARAPDFLKYLSSECASLNDAIRTAPARGVGYPTVGELRNEYEKKCREDESHARQLAANDQMTQSNQRMMALTATERGKEAAQAKAKQCSEMRDAIQARLHHSDALSASDRSALQTIETSYNDRCVRQ